MNTIEFSVENDIGILKLNRPKFLNAINLEMLSELEYLLTENLQNSKVLIITGVGKVFVAGADIKEMSDMDTIMAANFSQKGQTIMNLLSTINIPTIAAINGYAIGGGLELALACDIRIASKKAIFSQPETSLGIIPGFGGTQRLPRTIGRGRASYMIFTGEKIDANTALQWGLVDFVFKDEELLQNATKIAHNILNKSSYAISKAKEVMNRGNFLDVESGVKIETDVFAQTFAFRDQKEGMKAFVEKRKPSWK
jgi:enoyl-CoA hydratase